MSGAVIQSLVSGYGLESMKRRVHCWWDEGSTACGHRHYGGVGSDYGGGYGGENGGENDHGDGCDSDFSQKQQSGGHSRWRFLRRQGCHSMER